MSIEIKWTGGRTGNDLFQYSFARILGHKNDLKVVTPWNHQDFIKVNPQIGGQENNSEQITIQDLYHDQHDQDWHKENYKGKNLLVSGFFQHTKYYDQDQQFTRSIFAPEPVEKRPPEEIVMHYRLSDYHEVTARGSVIHPSWYMGILLNRIRFNAKKNKLFIVTDDPNDELLKNFRRFKPTIISETPKHDFDFIRQFDTIICGNSSFSWWASFLSDASKIYTFSRWMREPHGHIIRLASMSRATPVVGNWK